MAAVRAAPAEAWVGDEEWRVGSKPEADGEVISGGCRGVSAGGSGHLQTLEAAGRSWLPLSNH